MCGPPPDKQGPTYDQIVQAQINNEMWNYYQQNYKPVIDKYITNVTDQTTVDREKKQVAGKVNADVMKQAKPVSPTSTIANQKHMMNVADVNAEAQVAGSSAAKARKLGQQQNIINIGRGQTTKAMAGLDEMASMSVDTALRAKEREMRTEAATENAVGSTIGAAAGIGAGIASGRKMSPASMTENGALIYDSPEYRELVKKWGG